MTSANPQHCLCGSKQPYQQCCQGYHDGTNVAQRAEDLLRSRFSAFVLGRLDYIRSTTISSKQTENLTRSLQDVKQDTKWLSLKVLERFPERDKKSSNQLPQIRYVVFFEKDGQPYQMHELSHFVYEKDQLRYSHGEFKKDIQLGRNEPCWCGSEKKLKRCHETAPSSLSD